jgi:hypothetical protein
MMMMNKMMVELMVFWFSVVEEEVKKVLLEKVG